MKVCASERQLLIFPLISVQRLYNNNDYIAILHAWLGNFWYFTLHLVKTTRPLKSREFEAWYCGLNIQGRSTFHVRNTPTGVREYSTHPCYVIQTFEKLWREDGVWTADDFDRGYVWTSVRLDIHTEKYGFVTARKLGTNIFFCCCNQKFCCINQTFLW